MAIMSLALAFSALARCSSRSCSSSRLVELFEPVYLTSSASRARTRARRFCTSVCASLQSCSRPYARSCKAVAIPIRSFVISS